MSRMSAEEFLDKDTDHKLWTMFDKMQDGDVIMGDLRTDLDDHCEASIEDAHPPKENNNPGNPGTKGRIQEHKLKIIGGVVAIAVIITGYILGG